LNSSLIVYIHLAALAAGPAGPAMTERNVDGNRFAFRNAPGPGRRPAAVAAAPDALR
jgi:hypothetical protein